MKLLATSLTLQVGSPFSAVAAMGSQSGSPFKGPAAFFALYSVVTMHTLVVVQHVIPFLEDSIAILGGTWEFLFQLLLNFGAHDARRRQVCLEAALIGNVYATQRALGATANFSVILHATDPSEVPGTPVTYVVSRLRANNWDQLLLGWRSMCHEVPAQIACFIGGVVTQWTRFLATACLSLDFAVLLAEMVYHSDIAFVCLVTVLIYAVSLKIPVWQLFPFRLRRRASSL